MQEMQIILSISTDSNPKGLLVEQKYRKLRILLWR